jgi:hypothetical protein
MKVKARGPTRAGSLQSRGGKPLPPPPPPGEGILPPPPPLGDGRSWVRDRLVSTGAEVGRGCGTMNARRRVGANAGRGGSPPPGIPRDSPPSMGEEPEGSSNNISFLVQLCLLACVVGHRC